MHRKFRLKSDWLWLVLVVSVLPVFLGFLGQYHWILDVFSHFRIYYILLFMLITGTSLLFKKWRVFQIAAVFGLILTGTIIRFYTPITTTHDEEGLKIVSINLLSSNSEYEKVISFIESGNFDIVILQELNPKWDGVISRVDSSFKYRELVPRTDNFGIGVISKIEFSDFEILNFGTFNVPSILISFKSNNTEFGVLATHPLPPVGNAYFRARNRQFEQLNDFIDEYDHDLVLIGDLNSTSFSPNFRKLLKNGKMKDSRIGFGLQSSWNAQWPLIRLTIDHAFVSDGIRVLNRSVGPDIGSDHYPVILEVFQD